MNTGIENNLYKYLHRRLLLRMDENTCFGGKY